MSAEPGHFALPTHRVRRWPDYRTVWRWHFYAGLLCIPFVIWLSITGAIYLFKPQIESWLDRPYETLAIHGTPREPMHQVHAALSAVPGGVLNAYEIPRSEHSAVRILIGRGDELIRVYVHPETLAILKVTPEDRRPMEVIFHLHGELLQGDKGSMIVETAASWAVVMLITGLYLWWPRGNAGAAGVVFPRLSAGQRVFWRDLHAVTALWVSFFALFLLVSGLPWAKSWGGMLESVRQLTASSPIKQDWSAGRSAQLETRRAQNSPAPVAATGAHAGHHMGGSHEGMMGPDYHVLDRLVPAVQSLQLAYPAFIAPPSMAEGQWTARSDAQKRPLRVTLTLDAATGKTLSTQDFAHQPMLDRVIAVGVAAHEGQLFGPMNQALGVFTASGLTLVSISACVMWWRRRPEGVLGAPIPRTRARFAAGLFAIIAMLGIVLPLFGLTLLAVLLLEWLVLRRSAASRRFLGLAETRNA